MRPRARSGRIMVGAYRLDKETARRAKAAIREAEWFGEPAPEVKVSPHPLFGRAL